MDLFSADHARGRNIAVFVVSAYFDVTGNELAGGRGMGVADRARNEVRIYVEPSSLPAHLRSARTWRVRYESARGPAQAPVVMDTMTC